MLAWDIAFSDPEVSTSDDLLLYGAIAAGVLALLAVGVVVIGLILRKKQPAGDEKSTAE